MCLSSKDIPGDISLCLSLLDPLGSSVVGQVLPGFPGRGSHCMGSGRTLAHPHSPGRSLWLLSHLTKSLGLWLWGLSPRRGCPHSQCPQLWSLVADTYLVYMSCRVCPSIPFAAVAFRYLETLSSSSFLKNIYLFLERGERKKR